ncbi:hypothetical protein TherJR_1482 [Thermincola potens JR]|uniref:Uncharacterized protein n=1 Tax=Thermincola potens (strain JR) TaxID=635013 RepID=D5XFB5_THEPJ|nr:hypothetical protein TherJR_1482 [Thermincola potens JR]
MLHSVNNRRKSRLALWFGIMPKGETFNTLQFMAVRVKGLFIYTPCGQEVKIVGRCVKFDV